MIFYMLVGPSGCGKTTCAEKLCSKNDLHVSSDLIREELYGSPNIQGDPKEVFALMTEKSLLTLKDGKNVIYDATNLSERYRRNIIQQVRAKYPSCYMSCLIVSTTYEQCVANQGKRSRKVPEEVIKKQFRNFRMPTYSEGWDSIDIIHPFGTVTINFYRSKFDGILHDNPWHRGTIFDHMDSAVGLAQKAGEPEYIIDVLRFHDIGKFYTKTFSNWYGQVSDEAHYYGHEHVSSYLYLSIRQEELSEAEILYNAKLIDLHMAMHSDNLDRFRVKNKKYWNDLEIIHKYDEGAM